MTVATTQPKPAARVAELKLPLAETSLPTSASEVADVIRAAGAERQPVYPLGGQTSLDFGLLPARPGSGLDLTGLHRVVDYTPRDMTIVVEAGMNVSDLARTLAAENQWLPIDVPRSSEATLGGAVATNWNGSRRYGHGTWRDYIIGISAVDGRGAEFKSGGRVVKNVAGYDFCKLLTGSLGTLAVITQLVLKVKPRPAAQAMFVVPLNALHEADLALEALSRSAEQPTIIDLLVGNRWTSTDLVPESACEAWLAIGLEGTSAEVDWMLQAIASEFGKVGISPSNRLEESQAANLIGAMAEFSDRGPAAELDESPLAIKIVVPPSATIEMVQMLLAHDSQCSIQCHAGSGVVVARFAEFSASDLTAQLVGKLRPAAIQRGGRLIVLSTTLEGLTAPIVWGGRTATHQLLAKVKHAFDPHEILNPGRIH